ncbi:MAG: hypothetical protein E7066_08050 [Lentimicrobiaceae bacterium]|nr:hypothetical protein [Lentimicrobiaceae bacterium]
MKLFNINKIFTYLSDIDFDKPTGKCDICGHRTYLIKGTVNQDVCPWCKIMRLLVVLRLPKEVIDSFFRKVENKVNENRKVKIKL